MAAQLGSHVLLAYGPQGARQSAQALVLGSAVHPAPRRVSGGVRARWAGASPRRQTVRAPHEAARVLDHAGVAGWRPGERLEAVRRGPWQVTSALDDGASAPWGAFGVALRSSPRAAWGLSLARDDGRMAPWGAFERPLRPVLAGLWVPAMPLGLGRRLPWSVIQGGPLMRTAARWHAAAVLCAARRLPWARHGRLLAPGWAVVPPVDPGDPPAALLYILPARFYMSINNVFAERLPDGAEIPIYQATVSADAGSFAWSFTASGPESLFGLLAPVDGLPVRLRLTINGIAFVFLVESRQRKREFGRRAVQVSGRSATALLGSPWQREATHSAAVARTAQQLAADALDLTGVALDWGLTDWLVPPGAWSHRGTPLSAVLAVAQAAGGHVLSHRSLPTLQVRHPYPTAPWAWGTGAADVELAPDVLIVDGADERGGSDINAVYVSGTTAGVLGRVLRAGTAGDKLAPMVTDALITHVDAARQRGLAILGAAGAKQDVTLDLPVLTGSGADPGILDVGRLVQVNDAVPWRARVRAVTVSAAMPVVRQSIRLERHLEGV